MNLRTLLPLIFLLLVGSTAFAQDPPLVSGDPGQPSVPAQILSTEPQPSIMQSVQPAATDRPDVFNPPANFVAPVPKKADENPDDAPLLVPIPPAEEVPLNTAEYRSSKIPWEQFPTTFSPVQ